MNANEMTFGVEIETHMPYGSCNPGPHGHGTQVDWLPAGWLGDRDPSIIPPPNTDRIQCEFVSPILKGAAGLVQLCEVIETIKAHGGQVNASCGLHCHVGYDKRNTPAVGRLIALCANHEAALYAITGSHTRERGTSSRYSTNWCKSIKQYGNKKRAERFASRDRYHLLNLATRHPTVEFRVFGSSLSPKKACAYARICIALCEKSIVTTATARWNSVWKATKGGWTSFCKENAGRGLVETTRLIYSLGWKMRVASQQKFGIIEGDGIPTIEEATEELTRLADRYDNEIC